MKWLSWGAEMVEAIFWISAFSILYAYFGYPAFLYFLSFFKGRPVLKERIQPYISVIIAACNEERRIRDKIENTLSLDYPTDKKEIIVASDGSTDRTNEIASEYKERGVILVAPVKRRGKEAVQWEAIQVARGEILIFSDVATTLAKDGLLQIVSNFYDPTVGCVSSEDEVLADVETSGGEGSYVQYEMFLRRLESQVNSLVGLSGSFFAVRRELCNEWSTTLPSDFTMVISSVKQGYRGVSDPLTIGFYRTVRSDKDEFQRKVRTVLRGMNALMSHPEVLNPFRYGFFSIQIFSHKLFRWLVPIFMVIAFASNLALIEKSFVYKLFLLSQLIFYMLASLGLISEKLRRNSFFKMPAFLTLANFSIAVAWIRYLRGQRAILWTPSKR